ncbi:MAG: pantoate--beta-alanine ligase [Nitrospinae bacterium]|nr:pantoate--beta-alanine ligase [Nitrospinota bacterium]
MQVLKTIPELRVWRASARMPVGFVPTMGYLHEGHLSLVRRARAETATVAVSIFVNPTQFGPHEDFQTYPRDVTRDLQLLAPEGVDAVFVPRVEALYPEGASTVVTVQGLSTQLEGAARPGHFQGVATIVSKLFHLVEPQRAYFGEKDYQQLRLIQQMVRDLDMAIEVIGCPTIREPDGLAMSSRNAYLSGPERLAACTLSRALYQAQAMEQAAEVDASRLAGRVREMLEQEPLARIDYVAVVHPQTLQPLETLGSEGAVVCLAVWIGKTRLIDNVRLSL